MIKLKIFLISIYPVSKKLSFLKIGPRITLQKLFFSLSKN